MEKEIIETTKCYTCFSGADCIIVLNKKAYGEIESFTVDSIKKQIILEVTNFFSIIGILKEFSEMKDVELYELYADEYGNKMHRKFSNVTYIGEQYHINSSSLSAPHRIIFSYTPSEDNFYKETEGSQDDFINAIKNGEV